MSELKISVVVPIHGVENYLNKCLSSLADQDFEYVYEVLCINDNCNDNCEKIIDSFVGLYPHIFKKINANNGNLSLSRNIGIENASGDYLTFVDGDDYVSKDFLKVLFDTVKKGKLNLGVCNFIMAYEDGKFKKAFSSYIALNGFFNHKVALNFLMGDLKIRGFVWNKIYKRSFILEHNMRFCDNRVIIEDMWFNAFAFFYNDLEVGCSKKRCYYYVQRQGSLLHQGYKPLHLADIMVNLLKAIRVVELKNMTKFPTKLLTFTRKYIIHYSIFANRKYIPNYKKTIKKYSKDIRAIKKIKSIDEFDKDFLKIIGF